MEQTGQQKGKQMRFTEADRALIRNTFKDRPELLKLLRKNFLPEIDPQAPLGQIIDLWMLEDISTKDPKDAYINLVARNKLIYHIETCLLQLQQLADTKEETEAEEIARLMKNSAK